jgi:hypothetical protein
MSSFVCGLDKTLNLSSSIKIIVSENIFNAGIVARDGIIGLYRGFLPNALKTLPNSRFTFIAVSSYLLCNLGFSSCIGQLVLLIMPLAEFS